MSEGRFEGQVTIDGVNNATELLRVGCRDGRMFEFIPESAALIIIDMQKDFVDDDGYVSSKSPFNALGNVVPVLTQVLRAARNTSNLSVIHTREGYDSDRVDINRYKSFLGYVGQPGPNGPFLIRGTKGHDFSAAFKPVGDEVVIDKAGFSAFYQTGLEQKLKQDDVSHLILAGVSTQCCVHSTLRDAVERGFFCLTLEDCCAAEDPEIHEAVLRIIQAEENLFGWIADSESFLRALGWCSS